MPAPSASETPPRVLCAGETKVGKRDPGPLAKAEIAGAAVGISGGNSKQVFGEPSWPMAAETNLIFVFCFIYQWIDMEKKSRAA